MLLGYKKYSYNIGFLYGGCIFKWFLKVGIQSNGFYVVFPSICFCPNFISFFFPPLVPAPYWFSCSPTCVISCHQLFHFLLLWPSPKTLSLFTIFLVSILPLTLSLSLVFLSLSHTHNLKSREKHVFAVGVFCAYNSNFFLHLHCTVSASENMTCIYYTRKTTENNKNLVEWIPCGSYERVRNFKTCSTVIQLNLVIW